MAKPIESTPVLHGKDVEAFIASLKNAEYSEKKEQLLKNADKAYRKYIKKQG